MTTWALPPGQVGIGPQLLSPGAAAGHSPEVCLPVITVSILTVSRLFLEVIFLSLSLFWFILGSVSPYGGTASVSVWNQHQLFTSKQRKAVCWQVLWVLVRELRNLSWG